MSRSPIELVGRLDRSRLRRLTDLLVVAVVCFLDLIITDDHPVWRAGGAIPIWGLALVTIAVYASLFVRRRRPLLVLGLVWAFSLAALLLTTTYAPFCGLLVALHASAARYRRQTSALCLVLAMVPLALAAWFSALDRSNRAVSVWYSFALQLVLQAIVAITAWGLGRVQYAVEERHRRQREAQDAASRESLQLERQRIAGELHDSVTHAVTVMLLQAAGARRLVRPDEPELDGALAVIQSAGVQAMTEMHRLLGLLRDDHHDHDDPTAPQPMLDDVDALLHLTRATGLTITLATSGRRSALDPSVSLSAYRVIQEALTNTRKHMGADARVAVLLSWATNRVDVEVRAHGGQHPPRPVEPSLSSGYGLLGMAERVRVVGGSLWHGWVEDDYLVRASFPTGRSLTPEPAGGSTSAAG